ncbi:MAG: hypothetical protein JOZ33_03285 [Acidobacteriaceae bacterium]|nr:hypothetical protein [Acidobacteriaceae bacterium]
MDHTRVEIAKNGFEIAAYLAALAFFLYKALSGYFIVDMSIKVSTERKRKPEADETDYLGVKVEVKKGERGGVRLHDAKVRLRSAVHNAILSGPVDLNTIERANRTDPMPDPPNPPHRASIDWATIPSDAPTLNLPPGDETQLCAFFEIDTKEPYIIEVVILAQLISFGVFNRQRFGQWRASCVSLPNERMASIQVPNSASS